MDIVYIGAIAAFVVICRALAIGCGRLRGIQ
jgi:hypothetical protein